MTNRARYLKLDLTCGGINLLGAVILWVWSGWVPALLMSVAALVWFYGAWEWWKGPKAEHREGKR